MNQPLVSILINNYNYAAYLGEAIESALNQTYSHVEIIVVDDGSTDNSDDILSHYADRVRVIKQANGGQAAAFNRGFAESQGEIICFLDADDLFLPHKVGEVVKALATDDRLGWCFHTLELFDSRHQQPLPTLQHRGVSGPCDIAHLVQRGKLNGCLPFAGTATSGLCFRRSLLQQILPMPEVIRITSDDYLKYAAWGIAPGYALVENLTRQRIHGDNAYTNRPDKRVLYAHILLLTAYWLRHNFPVLTRFSNNLFANGIHLYHGFGQVESPDRPLVQQYLQNISWWEQGYIRLKLFYYQGRSLIAKN
jgi:glycosyltransferase involved in cell wall biosynthesis